MITIPEDSEDSLVGVAFSNLVETIVACAKELQARGPRLTTTQQVSLSMMRRNSHVRSLFPASVFLAEDAKDAQWCSQLASVLTVQQQDPRQAPAQIDLVQIARIATGTEISTNALKRQIGILQEQINELRQTKKDRKNLDF